MRLASRSGVQHCQPTWQAVSVCMAIAPTYRSRCLCLSQGRLGAVPSRLWRGGPSQHLLRVCHIGGGDLVIVGRRRLMCRVGSACRHLVVVHVSTRSDLAMITLHREDSIWITCCGRQCKSQSRQLATTLTSSDELRMLLLPPSSSASLRCAHLSVRSFAR